MRHVCRECHRGERLIPHNFLLTLASRTMADGPARLRARYAMPVANSHNTLPLGFESGNRAECHLPRRYAALASITGVSSSTHASLANHS